MMVVVGQRSQRPPIAAGLVTPHLSKRGLRAGGLSPRACAGVPKVWGHRGLSMREREKLEQCSQHRECVCLSLCRIMEWFWWEETLKIFQFHPLPWAGPFSLDQVIQALSSLLSLHPRGIWVPRVQHRHRAGCVKWSPPCSASPSLFPNPSWLWQTGSAQAGQWPGAPLPSGIAACPAAGPPLPRAVPGASGGLATARGLTSSGNQAKNTGAGLGEVLHSWVCAALLSLASAPHVCPSPVKRSPSTAAVLLLSVCPSSPVSENSPPKALLQILASFWWWKSRKLQLQSEGRAHRPGRAVLMEVMGFSHGWWWDLPGANMGCVKPTAGVVCAGEEGVRV